MRSENLIAVVSLALVGSVHGASCGLEDITMKTGVFKAKEYAFVDAGVDYGGAKVWCERFMATDEFGFPFGKLVTPTTEELNFIRENILPDPSAEFNTGHYKHQSSFDYSPSTFGISEGQHGDDVRNHWVDGEPDDHIGIVYSTNQYKKILSTGEMMPLYASSLVNQVRPFVCVRQITEEFPAKFGFFNEEYDCNYIVNKYPIGQTEYAHVPVKSTFEQAVDICDNLVEEGFPGSRLALLNTNDVNYIRHYLTESSVTFWASYKYNEQKRKYIDIVDGVTSVYHYDWDYGQPSGGDCVRAGYSTQYPFGPLETTDCNDEYIAICERPIQRIDTVMKRTFNGKEFFMKDQIAEFDTARIECEGMVEGGRLAKPTTEELLFIQENLIPGDYQVWLGYDLNYDDFTGSFEIPEYGITEDKHGFSQKHWIDEEPDCIGGISATTQYKIDRQTGEKIPLLTCSYYYDDLYFVCERDLNVISRESPDEVSNENEAEVLLAIGIGMFIVGALMVVVAVFIAQRKRVEVEEIEKSGTVVAYEHTL